MTNKEKFVFSVNNGNMGLDVCIQYTDIKIAEVRNMTCPGYYTVLYECIDMTDA